MASFIGGPLSATYLIAKNFKSLGKERAANRTLILGFAFTVVLFTTLAALPPSIGDKLPQHLIPIAYGFLGYLIVNRFQQRDIDAHLQAGGKKGSWQMIVVTGLVGLGVSLAYIFLIGFLISRDATLLTGEAYQMRKSGATIYYDKSAIPEADAMFVGIELEEMGYFVKDTQLPAGFRREGDKYTIELIVDNQHWDSPGVIDATAQFLRVLRRWHHDWQFQVRFVGADRIGMRKTKIISQ
ncbi:MAG TPA: hypothetical protein VLK27_11170 [Chthoniobacterales bacterium]|nr:hypothetical protein [Chthoniobacterales bacterium]